LTAEDRPTWYGRVDHAQELRRDGITSQELENPIMAKRPTTLRDQAAPITAAPVREDTTPARFRGPSLNRSSLLGRLCADPELKYTSTGIAVARLRIVTNDRQAAEFHDVIVWRQLAEIAAKHLAKGHLVYVEGHLHGRTWQGQDGTTRRSVEVVAENLQILTPKASEIPMEH